MGIWNTRKRMANDQESQYYQIYSKFRNQVRHLAWKVRIQEKSITAEAIKMKSNTFWNFAKSQTKTRDGVSDSKTEDNTCATQSDSEKAEVLLDQCLSVFTIEPDGVIPKIREPNITNI